MRSSLCAVILSSSLCGAAARLLRAQRAATVWRDCALEGEAVPKSGLTSFGFGDDWVEATLPQGASCTVAAFGEDPAPMIRKSCRCSEQEGGGVREELGVSWERCGSEGGTCSCASGTVRFGSGRRWAIAELGQSSEARSCSAEAVARGASPAARREAELPQGNGRRECWCRRSSERPAAAKVAIVLLSRRPFDIKTWFQYHLDYMGIDHIFMQVEDTPDFNSTFRSMSPAHQAKDRQMKAMRHAHAKALEMGIDWLIHTDDDELLYTPSHRTAGDVLASMPKAFDEAFMPNVEAVYPSADVQNCFTETTEFNSNIYSFVSYANGKAAVRVSNRGAQPAGPHMWRDAQGGDLNAIHLADEPFGAPLMVVHYESCPFKRWKTKYWELGNTSPEKVRNIPFPFYRESIEAMQHCASNQSSAGSQVGSGPCSDQTLKEFWSSFKTAENPHIRGKDLVAIEIPWAAIQKADL